MPQLDQAAQPAAIHRSWTLVTQLNQEPVALLSLVISQQAEGFVQTPNDEVEVPISIEIAANGGTITVNLSYPGAGSRRLIDKREASFGLLKEQRALQIGRVHALGSSLREDMPVEDDQVLIPILV